MYCEDCIHSVLLCLPVNSILRCRRINREWNNIIQSISDSQWKTLYHKRIGWIEEPMNPKFDWMNALLQAELCDLEIEVICSWNNTKIKLVAPWVKTKTGSSVEIIDTTIFIGTKLRTGVTRVMNTSDMSQGIHVHFIYDDAIAVRGIRKTCAKRGVVLCSNCEQKKYCRNQQYVYSMRKLNTSANDHLCMRVRGICVSE